MSGKAIIQALQNPLIAFLVSLVVLLVIGWQLSSWWIFGFTAVCTYLLSDIFLGLFIAGGQGIAKIPIIDEAHSKHKGHAYLALFIGVIISTLLSGLINELILIFVNGYEQRLVAMAIASFGLCACVFADLQVKFYTRTKK